MSVAKIIEVVGEGKTIEEATQNIVNEVSKTVKHIKGVNIVNFHADVDDNKVVKYRVDAKVAFVVK